MGFVPQEGNHSEHTADTLTEESWEMSNLGTNKKFDQKKIPLCVIEGMRWLRLVEYGIHLSLSPILTSSSLVSYSSLTHTHTHSTYTHPRSVSFILPVLHFFLWGVNL